MALKFTKEVEHAVSWLAAEFKFLKQLYDDLEIIQKEPIKEQEKKLKKDLRVIRFIGKSERRAGRDIQDIIQKIKKDRQKEILPENVKKLLDEVEIPANQLLKEGSLYVGKLKEQLNSIRTRVVLEEKYPKEETRAVVQQEIDQLKNKVRHLMTWIAAVDTALKKVELSVEKMNSINEINKRLAKHAEKISELWGAEWFFDIKELSEQVTLNNKILDEIDRVQQIIIFSHGGIGDYQYNFYHEPSMSKYLKQFMGPNYHILLSEKLNKLFDELLLLSKDLQVLLRNNKDNLTKEERFLVGSFLKQKMFLYKN